MKKFVPCYKQHILTEIFILALLNILPFVVVSESYIISILKYFTDVTLERYRSIISGLTFTTSILIKGNNHLIFQSIRICTFPKTSVNSDTHWIWQNISYISWDIFYTGWMFCAYFSDGSNYTVSAVFLLVVLSFCVIQGFFIKGKRFLTISFTM